MNTKLITTVLGVVLLGGGAVATGWYAAQDGSALSRGLAAVMTSGNTSNTQGTGAAPGTGGASATIVPGIQNDTGAEGTGPVVPTQPTNPTTPILIVPANPVPHQLPYIEPTPTTLPPTVSTPSQYRASAPTGRVVGGATIAGLKYRDSGSAVTRLQRCLVNAGTLDTAKVSGVFDKATRNALFLYQNGNRVPRTGLVDDKTNALISSQNICNKKSELPEAPRPLPPLLQEA